MRDLFLQITCVRMCMSRSGMSICTHVHAEEFMRHFHVHCTDTRGYRMPSLAMEDRALLDNGGWVGQRGWSSAMYVLCRVEY